MRGRRAPRKGTGGRNKKGERSIPRSGTITQTRYTGRENATTKGKEGVHDGQPGQVSVPVHVYPITRLARQYQTLGHLGRTP